MIFDPNVVSCFHFVQGGSETGKSHGFDPCFLFCSVGGTRISNASSQSACLSKTCLIHSKKMNLTLFVETEKIEMRVLNGLVILIFLVDFLRFRMSFRDVFCDLNRFEVQ